MLLFIYFLKNIFRFVILTESKIDFACRLLVQRENLAACEVIHACYCESLEKLTGTEETLVCCRSFFLPLVTILVCKGDLLVSNYLAA